MANGRQECTSARPESESAADSVSSFEPRAGRTTYCGLFLVILSALMYEILLTRIFSVSMRYHFAFMAISVALFGITFGATLVYVVPRFFAVSRTKPHAAASGLLFGVWMVLSLFIHLQIPHKDDAGTFNLFIVLTYLVISIPFVFVGVCITLILTRFPRQVGSLYGTDLLGSSLGCAAIVYLLRFVDGLNAVVVCALLACAGSVLLAIDTRGRLVRAASAGGCVLVAAFLALNLALTSRHSSLLQMKWVKGHRETEIPLFEKWNSFSRIRIYGNPDELQWPLDPGGSPNVKPTQQISRLQLDIDSDASTEMVRFTGDLTPHEYLKFNIVNLAHQLRRDVDVCVIGSGGGRDILSALVFGQRSVLAIEINQDISAGRI